MTATAKSRRGRRPKAPLVLAHGDPRHAAWLQHWRNVDGVDGATRAAKVDRFRTPIEVPADYPPPSPGVLFTSRSGTTRFLIPRGTPEFASFVAFERAQGPRGAHRATLIEADAANGRPLHTLARWAPIPGA